MIIQQPDADQWLTQRNHLTTLRSSLTTDGRDSRYLLLNYVFESMRKVRQYAQGKHQEEVFASGCRESTQFYIRCYDCNRDSYSGFLCEQCFHSGRHEGHRYLRFSHGQFQCSCGDQSVINPQGFCPHHQQQLSPSVDSSSIDRQVKKRLSNAIAIVFEELFHLCEINNYDCDYLLPRKNDRIDQKALSSLAICRYTQNIVELLCFFGRDYCQNNPGLTIALIEIITSKRTSKRNHVCNRTTIEDTFKSNKHIVHVCEKSILELLLMHAVFLSSKSEAINEFFRSLFRASKQFHKLFIEAYLSKYRFLIDPGVLDRFYPETSIHCLYSEFTQKDHIKQFLSSHNFQHLFLQLIYLADRLEELHKQENAVQQSTDLYEKAITPVLQLLRHLASHICTYKLEVECFKMVNELIRVSFSSRPISSKSLQLHKLKLNFDHHVLLLVRNLLRSLNFKEAHSKKLLEGLLFMYLNEKQTQLEESEHMIFHWYNLPERVLAVVLLAYYTNYSLRQTKEIFNRIFDDRTCEAIIKQLLTSFDEQERQLERNVYELEENIQGLVEGVLRNPNNLMFDCDQLCLQLFILLSEQELFVKYVFDAIPEPRRARLILDLVLEESYFVNVCGACGWGDTAAAKKLHLINAFNTQNAQYMELQDILELYDQAIFNIKTLGADQALTEIGKFDEGKQAFQLNQDLQGFTFVEPWLFVRNRELFGMLQPPNADVSLSSFQQNSLLRKQTDMKLDTFCCAVSKAITESLLFISNVVVKLYRELWKLQPSDIAKQKQQVNTKLKLLQILLIRNSHNEEFASNVEGEAILAKKDPPKFKTEVHMILMELSAQFQNDCLQNAIRESQENAKTTKSSISKIKTVATSQDIGTEEEIPAEEQAPLESAECLQCCKATAEQLVCGLRILSVTTAETPSLCFDCCQHAYHRSCLTANNLRQFVCPKCHIPYPLLLPWIHTYYTFFKKNTIAIRIIIEKGASQKQQELKQLTIGINRLLSKNAQLQVPLRPQLIEQMIVSRLHLSLALPPLQFVGKLYYCMRSFFGLFLYCNDCYRKQPYFTKQSLNEAIVINDQHLLTQITGRRAHTYRQLLVLILRMAATFDSVKFNQLLKRVINKYFNAYLALKISGECGGSLVTVEELSKRFNADKERYLQHMVEFSRGVMYMFALAYDDAGLSQLPHPTDVINRNQQFFSLDLQMITTLVYLLNKQQQPHSSSDQPIVNLQKLIDLPNSYLEFHGKYYDLACHVCGSFPPDETSQLLCLLCGYCFCNYQCQEVDLHHLVPEDGQTKLICTTGLKHSIEKHNGLAVLMNIEDTSVLLFEEVTIEYGQLYRSKLGRWNPRKDSNWEDIILSHELLGRLDAMARNRKIYHEIIGKMNAPQRNSMVNF